MNILLNFSNFSTSVHGVLIKRLLWILFLFSVCRFLFYQFNQVFFPDITPEGALKIFIGGVRFDVVAILYTNILYILLMLVPFKFKYKAGFQTVLNSLFIFTNAIALLPNCADFIYYQFTVKRCTWAILGEFSNEGNLNSVFDGFLVTYWYILVIYLMMVATLFWVVQKTKVHRIASQKGVAFYVKHVVIMVIGMILFVGGVRGGFLHSTRPITMSNAGEYVERPKELYLVLNTPFCIYKTIGQAGYKKVEYYQDPQQLATIFNPIHSVDSVQAPFKKMNVVILIWESLGKELVGGYNQDLENGTYKGFTPFVDSLMRESKVYWHSFANGTKSIEAIPSILTSIPGVQEPFISTQYTNNNLPSLPRMLEEKGYHTSFFHGAPNGSMGFLAFCNLIGIKNYYGKTEYNNDQDFDGIWGIWDEEFLQYWANSMNSFPQPFMSTLFTVSSHDPFKVPEKYNGRFPKGPLPVCQTMGYTDYSLEKFFQVAKTMPWYENTLFIITADHATFAHYPEYQTSVGNFSIPILFFCPSDSSMKGIDYNKIVQQIDIMPSVLGYLNYDKPYFSFGKNVFKENSMNYAVNYDGVYQWYNGPYVLQYDGEKALGLYNYQQDKRLKNNLKGQLPAVQNPMQDQVKAFIQQYMNRMLDDKLIP